MRSPVRNSQRSAPLAASSPRTVPNFDPVTSHAAASAEIPPDLDTIKRPKGIELAIVGSHERNRALPAHQRWRTSDAIARAKLPAFGTAGSVEPAYGPELRSRDEPRRFVGFQEGWGTANTVELGLLPTQLTAVRSQRVEIPARRSQEEHAVPIHARENSCGQLRGNHIGPAHAQPPPPAP